MNPSNSETSDNAMTSSFHANQLEHYHHHHCSLLVMLVKGNEFEWKANEGWMKWCHREISLVIFWQYHFDVLFTSEVIQYSYSTFEMISWGTSTTSGTCYSCSCDKGTRNSCSINEWYISWYQNTDASSTSFVCVCCCVEKKTVLRLLRSVDEHELWETWMLSVKVRESKEVTKCKCLMSPEKQCSGKKPWKDVENDDDSQTGWMLSTHTLRLPFPSWIFSPYILGYTLFHLESTRWCPRDPHTSSSYSWREALILFLLSRCIRVKTF